MATDSPAGSATSRGTGAGSVMTGRALKSETHPVAFPEARPVRERLRAICCDVVAGWRTAGGPPPDAKTRAGLEAHAEAICRRAGVGADLVGWTMVALVSEFWRGRLAAATPDRRLVLLPDCPNGRSPHAPGTPAVCGPACEVATLWSAARDSGWIVLPTSDALSAIGGLLTGQYGGVLGLAELDDLRKAFAMIPCFSLPIAAVPIPRQDVGSRAGAEGSGGPGGGAGAVPACNAAIDVDTALGFLGVACGNAAPVGDYLPVLREAAAMFRPESLASILMHCGAAEDHAVVAAAGADSTVRSIDPLHAAEAVSVEFLAHGGKFLRPFICLAAYDAAIVDRPFAGQQRPAVDRASARTAAVSIEIFHKASLVHDDIEDDDAMRYGRPTLHRVHGIPSAVNVGDYLLGLGYRLIAGVGTACEDREIVPDLLRILSDAHVRLARGQGAELWWRDSADKRLSPSQALAIYALKTSPAFEAAIAMGLRLAGCLPEAVAPISRYATHVGTAFQILNDLKDWSGDAENQRKAAGDLLGGRPTVLLALALERLDADAADRLVSLASGVGTGDDEVSEAAALFERADVFRAAGDLVSTERRQAVAAIATCRMPRVREVLEFLLDLAVPDRGLSA